VWTETEWFATDRGNVACIDATGVSSDVPAEAFLAEDIPELLYDLSDWYLPEIRAFIPTNVLGKFFLVCDRIEFYDVITRG
jgi:hypothetical protein